MDIWSLFDEDSEPQKFQSSTTVTTATGAVTSIDKPTAPRDETQLAGIRNLGATCYANSLVQTMYHTPGLRERLYQLTEQDLGVVDGNDQAQTVRKIPLELLRLFGRMQKLNVNAVELKPLTTAFGWERADQVRQQDVQELNRVLFDALEKSFVGSPGHDIIPSLYCGENINIIQCLGCGYTSRRVESFQDISVPVDGLSNLQQGLEKYTEMEELSGGNQYRCGECGNLCDAYKGIMLGQLPPILTLSLNRFRFDWQRGTRHKVTNRYTFPLELEMKPYQAEDVAKQETRYFLYSVVIHTGAAHGGHYFAYIRDFYQQGEWREPPSTPKGAYKKPPLTATRARPDAPVRLVHDLIVEFADENGKAAVDSVCQSIQKHAGGSWSKVYKRKHGTFTAFAKAHPSVFNFHPPYISLTKAVTRLGLDKALSFKGDPNVDESHAPASSLNAASDAVVPSDDGDSVGVEAQDGQLSEAADASASPPKRKNKVKVADLKWFEMNDSNVTPISKKHVEKAFEGRSSAYMLFYVRADSVAQAMEMPSPPEFVCSAVDAENEKFKTDREEYEIAINTYTMRVASPAALVPNGLFLEPSELIQTQDLTNGPKVAPESALFVKDFVFDRRDPMANVLQKIKAEFDWEGDCVLSSLQAVSGNAQFYIGNELPIERTAVNEVAADISGKPLLLWDGATINGTQMAAGEANKPTTVSVYHLQHSRPASVLQVTLPLSATLNTLRQRIMDLTDIASEYLLLFTTAKIPSSKSSKDAAVFDIRQHDLKCTLADANVTESTAFSAELTGRGDATLGPDFFETKAKDANITLECEFNPQTSDNDTRPAPIKATVPRSTTIAGLKQILMERFSVPSSVKPASVAVRWACIDDAQSGIPRLLVDEAQKLQDLAVKEDDSFTLVKESVKKYDGQLLLRLKLGPKAIDLLKEAPALVGSPVPLQHRVWEFAVPLDATVPDVRRLAVEAMGVDTTLEMWHMCRSNWCGERGEDMNDVTTPVKQLHLPQSSIVFLEEGSIVAKGSVTVHVWLDTASVAADVLESMPDTAHTKKIREQVVSDASGDASVDGDGDGSGGQEAPAYDEALFKDAALKYVGPVTLRATDTVRTLKEKISNHDAISHCAPSVEFLRFRDKNAYKQGRLIRNDSQALKKGKVFNNSAVCVTVLPEPEALGQHDMFLRLCVRNSVEKTTTTPMEVLFQPKNAPTFAELQAWAEAYTGIPVNQQVLAKHIPAKGTWKVIENPAVWQASSKKKKGGRGKKGNHAPSLLKGPAHLQDGDVIVVKDKDSDPEGEDDLRTLFDITVLAAQQQQIDAKRKDRQQRKSDNPEWYGSRAVEVGISIAVPDFSLLMTQAADRTEGDEMNEDDQE
eukprot:m.162258 g.162258  ORF g.162258 m.162258 type:complete len:1363 (-) comp14372_c0_seq4:137-4225(-)